MEGPRNQFLARAGLSIDQHRRVRKCDGLDLAQHVAQRVAAADDLLEVELGADFVLEIHLLLREFVRERGDPVVRDRVLHGDGDLRRHVP
jgi:hypothetical protein